MAMIPPVDTDAPRFFLDSSVILAGSASLVGASHALLVMAELGLVKAVTIPYIFDEVERNLTKKLVRGLARYQQIRTSIDWEVADNPVPPEINKWTVVLPLKDAPVLAAAVIANPARLITLDTKHFIDLPQVAQQSGLIIATPRNILIDIRAALAAKFGSSRT